MAWSGQLQKKFWMERPEMAAETTEVHKHWSSTKVQKGEQRSQEEDKAVKEEWTEEQCKNTEKGMMSGNSKEAYSTLKALTKIQQRKSAVIEDGSGNILMESTAVQNRWTEYWSTTVNASSY